MKRPDTRDSLVLLLFCVACTSSDPVAGSGDTGSPMTTGDTTTDTTAPGEATGGTTTDATSEASSDDGSPLGAQCDVFEQDCPDGYKCGMKLGSGDFSLVNVCVPAGSEELGDACAHEGFGSGIDTCNESGWCFGEATMTGEWTGICRAWCEGTAQEPSCDLGASCFDSAATPVCVPSCDPLADDCPEGEACLFRYTTSTFTCYAEGEAEEGEACGPLAACTEGNVCWPSPPAATCDSSYCCTRYCDITASDCAEGLECIPLVPDDPEHGDVGACVVTQ